MLYHVQTILLLIIVRLPSKLVGSLVKLMLDVDSQIDTVHHGMRDISSHSNFASVL